jgi:glycosyltransferase involved in cell wall biosynthesis
MPKTTFLLPAYNSGKYIADTIQSVLAQTERDFELLIIDDASPDNTFEVASSFQDRRIKLIKNPHNLGLVGTLNMGLDMIDSDYIARMDNDDICVPNRLEKQLSFMEVNKEVGLCGSSIQYFPNHLNLKLPVFDSAIKFGLLFGNTIAHPSVILRRSALRDTRYSEEFTNAEDYEMWTRLALKTKFYNIPDYLIKYRIHENQMSSRKAAEQQNLSYKIKQKFLSHFLDISEDPELFLDTVYRTSSLKRSQKLKLLFKIKKINVNIAEYLSSHFNRYL